MIPQIERLKRKRQIQSDVKVIYDTPEGKRFFQYLADRCGVTKPKFSREPYEVTWNESRRHLAMELLALLGQDDVEALIRRFSDSLSETERLSNE